ncbi:MAG: sigma 54-interacting transcriptional regulator [Deltaproteobacteria bacterium]|nr:sigma 54-interacting transcriptional regulator [Deltaproteobacteria bacterium]MBT4641248.1 sigma 54-interacting transcriptional regulator [Deltaproteobacteria bacterium]
MDRQTIKKRANLWAKQHQNLLESINIAFLLADWDYNLWYVNDEFLRLIGAETKDFPNLKDGIDLRSYMSPSRFEASYNVIEPIEQRVKDQKMPGVNKFYKLEMEIKHFKTGENIPVLASFAINIDDEGNHDLTFVTYTDLREQKQIQQRLENEKNKLEAILFGIGDCVSVFDLEGELLLRNPHGLEILRDQNKALLPLNDDIKENIILDTAEGSRNYECKMKSMKDSHGSIFAYVEILKDITPDLRLKEQEREFRKLKRKMMRLELQSEMIGVSRSMRNIFDLMVRCGEVDSTVLIQGETGVGKELVARGIHGQSSRQDKPFVAVNCGALPENLLESELFGHIKGAFTGAVSERKGLFREAEGGTIFLDEIGDLNPVLQVKLLRALQEKEIRPVGSDKSFQIDVRIIAATNRDLKKMAELNLYRQDLYYRLAVISIFVPPLRERKDDILPLAEYFIKRKTVKTNKILKAKILNHASQQVLLDYSWPGNIRELENCIEHAWAISLETVIKPEDLPVQIVFPREAITLSNHDTSVQINPIPTADASSDSKPGLMPWEEEEKKTIEEALIKQKGHRTKTAQALGMNRATLWRKIKIFGIRI